jgi:ankyrin repeat protein
LTPKDGQVGTTALGWARHFGRTEMIALLERHAAE